MMIDGDNLIFESDDEFQNFLDRRDILKKECKSNLELWTKKLNDLIDEFLKK